MMPASTNAAGETLANPDVCKTPAGNTFVPVPYPNTGMLAQTLMTATRVTIEMRQAVTLTSQIPTSTGDEAGTGGGVTSGVFKGPVLFKKGSSKVFIEGAPAIYHTAVTQQNGTNANVPAGQVVAPSQAKVFVAP
jgi:hypothetical protein